MSKTIHLAISELPTNTGGNVETSVCLSSDEQEAPDASVSQDETVTIENGMQETGNIITGQKQLAMLERAILWLDNAKDSLAKFSQEKAHSLHGQASSQSSNKSHDRKRHHSGMTSSHERTFSLCC